MVNCSVVSCMLRLKVKGYGRMKWKKKWRCHVNG